MPTDLSSHPVATLRSMYCECGCGEKTTVAKNTDARHGWVKGQPRRFIRGHAARVQTFDRTEIGPHLYVTEDRGHGSPCWVWQGATDVNGYGRLSARYLTSSLAHRLVYEKEVGPIQDGHDLHHECGVRACVNPAHLTPLPVSEHRGLHRPEVPPTCPHGHAFTPANTYITPAGWRQCRTCKRTSTRRWKRAHK